MTSNLNKIVQRNATNQIDILAEEGELDMIEYLWDEGERPSTYALDMAAINNHFDVVKFLHEKKAPYLSWVPFSDSIFNVVKIAYGEAEYVTHGKIFDASGGYLAIMNESKRINSKDIVICRAVDRKYRTIIKIIADEGSDPLWSCADDMVKLNAQMEYNRIINFKKKPKPNCPFQVNRPMLQLFDFD